MSYKTIYTCDKCGKEQNNPDQFWTVGVSANHATYPSQEFVTGKSMHVCRNCLESFGIHVTKRAKEEKPEQVIPTVEELIRELIQRCQ